MSLFVYPPKYGYFELSVFDYELLCLNGARSWTSLQFVQVRTSPTSHAATTFWSRSFVASLSTRYWQVTTLYRVLHAQLSEDAHSPTTESNTAFLVCTVLRGMASLNLYGRKNRAACQIPPDKSIWENLTKIGEKIFLEIGIRFFSRMKFWSKPFGVVKGSYQKYVF